MCSQKKGSWKKSDAMKRRTFGNTRWRKEWLRSHAVEAQTTDHTYRIGQRKNVVAHPFITKNTFEEKINAMIENKRALADLAVATCERWIANLNDAELSEVFSFRGE